VKEIIILGMGATMIKCPYDVEVWAVNQTYKVARKVDKLFITDPRYNFKNQNNHNWDELNSLNIPIVSLHKFPELKRFVRFPYDRIVERFGIQDSEYFSNTICYMVAYALYKGYKKIRLYGVDLATSTEYILEKGGVEFWLGIAIGMGVKVENTKGSMVLKTPNGVPYGHKYSVNMKEVDPYDLCKGNTKSGG
jgi:hypothetical protein|tara:strand:- start:7787 stop:8365 length:579 start_codon:yes stop_codon:yes gene_type:complete